MLTNTSSNSAVSPLRFAHVGIAAFMCAFVSWGLLTSDPLAVVRNSPLAVFHTVNDVIIHTCVYTAFSFSCLSLMRRETDAWVRSVILTLLVAHALGTELLQTLIPHRTGDPFDAVANLLGITIGTLLVHRFSQLSLQPVFVRRSRRESDQVSGT